MTVYYRAWWVKDKKENVVGAHICSTHKNSFKHLPGGIAEAAERPARAVLLQSTQAGAEGKVAFCAGGDVKSVAQAVKEDPASCFPRLQLAHEYLGVAALSKKREDGTPVICFMDAWWSFQTRLEHSDAGPSFRLPFMRHSAATSNAA